MPFPPKTLADWQALAQRELKNKPLEGLYQLPHLKPIYTKEDLENLPITDDLPGFAPFTRGVRATMYAGQPWTIRQYAGFSTAEESNAFYKKNLTAGQKGLSIAFDLATHRGYDSDHPRVTADVGKAGVAIDSIEDMKRLFGGIDLGNVSVSMTMNGAVLPVLACFIAAAEEQGIAQEKLSGTIQNDILKEFMVRNTYIFAPEPSMRIVSDIIAYTHRHMPKFNSVSISGYHMHEAGASAVQELAYTLADGETYVKTAMANGLAIDDFAPRLSFFFGIGMHFFLEIAKLRAARLLWAHIMQNLGAQKNESLMLRTHCQTSGVSLTAQDPYNNIVRTTVEALAAVLGGTQSLHTNALDEAIALPTDFSARIARNTQLILAHETHIPKVTDPLGGSYYVESLTHSLATHAWEEIERIRSLGGMVKLIESGEVKRAIEASATRKQAAIDSGEDMIVGMNCFVSEEAGAADARVIDNSKVRETQIAGLQALRANRDDIACRKALSALEEAAKNGSGNLLELHIVAAKVRASVGEMTAALEKIWPRYESPVKPAHGIYRREFKGSLDPIIERTKEFERLTGRRPVLFIAKLGQDGHDRGAKIVASAFLDMGFTIRMGKLFQTPKEAVLEATGEPIDAIGISTLAGAHTALVPELISELKTAGYGHIPIFCGGIIPEQDFEMLYAAGVNAIFIPGTPIPQAAEKVLNILEETRRKGNYFKG